MASAPPARARARDARRGRAAGERAFRRWTHAAAVESRRTGSAAERCPGYSPVTSRLIAGVTRDRRRGTRGRRPARDNGIEMAILILMVEPPLTAQPVSMLRFTRSLYERSPSNSGVRSRRQVASEWSTEDTHFSFSRYSEVDK